MGSVLVFGLTCYICSMWLLLMIVSSDLLLLVRSLMCLAFSFIGYVVIGCYRLVVGLW